MAPPSSAAPEPGHHFRVAAPCLCCTITQRQLLGKHIRESDVPVPVSPSLPILSHFQTSPTSLATHPPQHGRAARPSFTIRPNAPPCSPKPRCCPLSLLSGRSRALCRAGPSGAGAASAAGPRPPRARPGCLGPPAGPPGGAPQRCAGLWVCHTEPGGACGSATCAVTAGAFPLLVPRLTVAGATGPAWA